MRRAYLLAGLCALAATRAVAVDFIDVAPVVAVTPLYGPVMDARDCAPGAPPGAPQMVGAPGQQMVGAPGAPQVGAPPPPQERSMVAPVVGGAAGALIGSQVGSGRGRDAATAVGAVAGTVVADRIANPNAPSSTTGAVIGGAAGGLIGNQVGQGSGRTAATAAGAIGGAMVGDRIGTSMQGPAAAPPPGAVAPGAPGAVPVAQAQPCRTVDGVQQEAIRGYSVVYRYAGRDITTTLPFHPGHSMPIAIGAADNMQAPAAPAPAGGGYAPPPGGYAQPPGVYAPQRVGQPPVPAGGTYQR